MMRDISLWTRGKVYLMFSIIKCLLPEHMLGRFTDWPLWIFEFQKLRVPLP